MVLNNRFYQNRAVLLCNPVHLQNVFCLTDFHQITYLRHFLSSPKSKEKETTEVTNIEVTMVCELMPAISGNSVLEYRLYCLRSLNNNSHSLTATIVAFKENLSEGKMCSDLTLHIMSNTLWMTFWYGQ